MKKNWKEVLCFWRAKKENHVSSLGKKGENDACLYLKNKGYRIISRNVRNKKGYALGEIDIIAEREGKLIFVEVKARTQYPGDEVPVPEIAITPEKLFKIQKIIHTYLRRKYGSIVGKKYQIDAIALVYFSSGRLKTLRHLENIFF